MACRDSPASIVNRVNRGRFTSRCLACSRVKRRACFQVDQLFGPRAIRLGSLRADDLVGIDVISPSRPQRCGCAFERAVHSRLRPYNKRELVEGAHLADNQAQASTATRRTIAWMAYRKPPRSLYTARDERSVLASSALAIMQRGVSRAVGEMAWRGPSINDRSMKLAANHPVWPFERTGAIGMRQSSTGCRRCGPRGPLRRSANRVCAPAGTTPRSRTWACPDETRVPAADPRACAQVDRLVACGTWRTRTSSCQMTCLLAVLDGAARLRLEAVRASCVRCSPAVPVVGLDVRSREP